MRKHNRKFATRFGSASVDAGVPQMAHKIVHSKGFQLAANNLLVRMLRRAGLAAPKVVL